MYFVIRLTPYSFSYHPSRSNDFVTNSVVQCNPPSMQKPHFFRCAFPDYFQLQSRVSIGLADPFCPNVAPSAASSCERLNRSRGRLWLHLMRSSVSHPLHFLSCPVFFHSFYINLDCSSHCPHSAHNLLSVG